MRRNEKEVSDFNEIEEILERAEICRLALCVDNVPYVIPMNYGYKNNCLYLHSAKEGKKIDILKQNPNVCFEVDIDSELVKNDISCKWGMKFKSVIGFGIAQLLEEKSEKKEALDIIMKHYSNSHSFEYSDAQINAVAVIVVRIEKLTCKKSGY